MIQSVQGYQDELLVIIEKLFDTKNCTINPSLHETDLNNIMKETRDIIIQLYIKCEQDFRKGLAIYKKIVDTKSFQKIKNRRIALKTRQERIAAQ